MKQGLDEHPQAAGLRQGVAALGLALSDAQLAQLLAYLDLLGKWNRVYNLTAVRQPQDMLRQHLLDSLAVWKPLRERLGPGKLSVLDVGSGGGLPGVVLAIADPQLQVTCIDAVAKKASFVQHVAGNLGLPNLSGCHGRVEQVQESFDLITSRAFAALDDFVGWSHQALVEGGCWMAMKGKRPDEEIQTLPSWVEVFHVEPLAIPGLEAERCLVWLRRTKSGADLN